MMFKKKKSFWPRGTRVIVPGVKFPEKCAYTMGFALTAVVDPPTGVEPAPTAAETAPGAPTALLQSD